MKRFPIGVTLFTLVWALALFLPPTREISRSVPLLLQTQTYWQVPPSLPDDDPIAIEWRLEGAALPIASNIKTLHQMDVLAARYPAQLWIPAMRLLQTVKVADVIEPITGNPQKNKKQPLDAHKLEQAAQIAAQGAKRDPDNSFWPWMEASLRFSLGQKARGIAAMQRAGKAPHFDDYLQSTLQARLALWKKHDNPAWEQRIAVWAGALYPHLAAMRGASNAAAIEAADARSRGDNLRAIEIASALLRANQVWRRDSFVTIGDLVAEASGFDVLNKLFNGRTKNASTNINEREKRSEALRKQWIQFARVNGRSDVAQNADWTVKLSVRRETSNFFGNDIWGEFGVSPQQGRLSALAPLLLFGVALQSLFLASVWLIGALASVWAKNGAAPSRGQTTTCANFGFWSLLGAGIVTYQVTSTHNSFPFLGFTEESLTPLPFLLITGFALACWLLPVAFFGMEKKPALSLGSPTTRSTRASAPFRADSRRAVVAFWNLLRVCGNE